MADISVYYKPIILAGQNTPYYHEYLVYTDDNGVQSYFRGGPASNQGLSLDSGGGSASSGSGSGGSGVNVPFGQVITSSGAYQEDTIDFPSPGVTYQSQSVLSGSDAQLMPIWTNITQQLGPSINAANYGYDFTGPNSNSVISSVLNSEGIPLPQSSNLSAQQFPTPGSDVPLSASNSQQVSSFLQTVSNAGSQAVNAIENQISNFASDVAASLYAGIQSAITSIISGVVGATETQLGASDGVSASADSSGDVTYSAVTSGVTYATIFNSSLQLVSASETDPNSSATITTQFGSYGAILGQQMQLQGIGSISYNDVTNSNGQLDNASPINAVFSNGLAANFLGSSFVNQTTNANYVLGGGAQGTYITSVGTGNIYTGNIGNTIVLVGDGSSATVDAGSVGLNDSNQQLTLTDSKSGAVVTTSSGLSGLVVNGSGYAINLGSGSSGDFFGATNVAETGNTGSVAQVIGTNSVVTGNTGNNTLYVDGTSTSTNVDDNTGTIIVTGNDDTVHASGNGAIDIGPNVTGGVVYANMATINEQQNDQIDVIGTQDQVNGNSTDDNTGDTDGYTGTGGYSAPPPPDPSPPPPYYGGDGGGYYGGDGYDDFVQGAKALSGGVDAGQIAAYDNAVGATTSAAVKGANAGLAQAQLAAASTGDAGAATTPVLSGPVWEPTTATDGSRTITVAFANTSGAGQGPFSSAVGMQDQTTIDQALQAWSNATGLTFEQVAASSNADINVGFSDLDTSSTGLLGYTTNQTTGGAIQSSTIRLEDPSQTALSSAAGGQATYAGTDSTLYQVALHEIGHAIGLADDADPNSVLFASSSASNQTLDATDLAGAQLLYGGPAATTPSSAPATAASGTAPAASSTPAAISPATDATGVNQMIQAMATFAPQPSSATLVPPQAANTALAQQLAAPLHH